MTGPRYFDWRHTHVVGDRGAAQLYRKEAEKLLGFVAEDAARNGLQTHVARRELADGALIAAELRGGIPRVTIVPPTPSVALRKALQHGFHLSWSQTTSAYTPVLFSPPPAEEGEDGWRDWQSLFFNADAVGYAGTPEDRRSGSYIGTFGVKAKEPGYRLLPTGGLWYHPEKREALSWFRGYKGYWPQHYRHPSNNYSSYVTAYGHLMYVAPVDSWRVMAAGMREGWMYVLLAEDLGALEPPPVSDAPTYSGQVWFSQPFADDAYTYSLRRYPVSVVTEPETGVETYRAGAHEDSEELWRGTLQLAYGAWSFNRDCSEVVTLTLPRISVWCSEFVVDGAEWVLSDTAPSSFPEEETQRIAITIDHGGDEPVASLSTTDAFSAIAEEDGAVLELVEYARSSAHYRVDYKLGDFTVPLVERVNSGGDKWFDRRALMSAHLPSRTLLFYRWRTDITPGRYVEAGFELYVDGVLEDLGADGGLDTTFASDPRDEAFAGNFLWALGTMYDDGVTSWFRPMDAMTLLYGFTFQTQGALPTSGSPVEPGYGYQTCPHIDFFYADSNYLPHTAAGGYVFGSVGGATGHYWGPAFTYAAAYGANSGQYSDDNPELRPVPLPSGAVSSFNFDTVGFCILQPLQSPLVGGSPSGFSGLTNALRASAFGTNGDAKSVVEPVLLADTEGHLFCIGHTGEPRMNQRGSFQWQ